VLESVVTYARSGGGEMGFKFEALHASSGFMFPSSRRRATSGQGQNLSIEFYHATGGGLGSPSLLGTYTRPSPSTWRSFLLASCWVCLLPARGAAGPWKPILKAVVT